MEEAREHFRRGVELQERGLFDQAIDAYTRALSLDPAHEDAAVNLGAAWLQKGVGARAIDVLGKVLTRNPDHALALFNIAKAYLFVEDHVKALAAFERTAEFLPDDLAVIKGRAQALAALGRLVEAAETLLPHLEKLAADPDTLLRLGGQLLELQRWADAAEVFRRALNAAPSSIPALEGLIRAQLALGALDKAGTSIKRALLMAPQHPGFHLLQVELLLAEHQVEGALDHLKKALQRLPDEPALRQKMDELLRRLPVLQKKAGEARAAREGARPTARPSPYETQVYDVLDALYDGRITFPMAIHEIRDLYRKDEDDLFVCDELANLLFQARQFGEAAQLYSRLYGARPREPRYRIDLAKAMALDGDPYRARQFLADSMHELPQEPDLPLTLVEIKLLEKDFQGALQTLMQTLADFPDHPHGLFLRGYVALRLDDLAGAEAAFQRLLPLAPQDEEVAVWYGRLSILRHRPADGLAVWERFSDGLESLVEILSRVELLLAAGRAGEVKPLLQRIGDYKPRFLEDHLLFGKAFFFGGDFAGALSQLEAVLREDPDHAEALAVTALAYLGRSKPNKFWIYWQRAIESDSLPAVWLGHALAPVMQFAQAERIRVETRKLLEIAVADDADRARLTRLLQAYGG
ncbi:MAG: TPR repeat [Candidatus Ozemobacter sibiricus]|jgi:tetratricopeptide (TPR) repeat protein|uniref:TPR repeat n=1 Tax=Candidatus Ozemobacter sibiricus TaxID=2268124 RepID=A0A367ZJV3_9BACT|nr:MAG: TPR repeat [Candidatus Ozemobacter sibiricus]